MKRQFAVVGLGRVGVSLARTLDSMGHEVLGVDHDREIVQDLSSELPNVNLVSADAAESGVLEGLGLDRFDAAAVMIGESIQASVLITLILKDLEVPMVLARANNPLHARVLERVGADQVVEPEREFGEFLAHRIASPGILDYLDLGEDEAVVQIKVPKKWAGKSLVDLGLPQKTGIIIMAVKPHGGRWGLPDPSSPLQQDDTLVVGGPKKKLDELDLSREK